MLFHIPFTLPAVSKTPVLPQGSLGVSFFFVLSGFILAYAHPLERPLAPRAFYWARFARIYPLHLLTLMIWVALFYVNWGAPGTDKLNSTVANLLLVQALMFGPAFNLGLNAVSWSLSVEAVFYLLFPLVRRPRIALGWIAAFVTVAMLIPSPLFNSLNIIAPSVFYFNPFARLAEFCTGILAYQAIKGVSIKRFGTVAEAVSLAAMFAVLWRLDLFPRPLRFSMAGLAFLMVIAVFSRESGLLSRGLRWKPLVLLGNASFAIYMTHHMVFRFIGENGNLGMSGWPLFAAATAITIAISIALHFGFEQPMQRLLTGRLDFRVKGNEGGVGVVVD